MIADPNDYELHEEYDLSKMTEVSGERLGSQPLTKEDSKKRPVAVTVHSDASPDYSNCVLIVTVTKVETQAVLQTISQASGTAWKRQPIGSKTYYSLGTVGGTSVFLVQSEMGIATPRGALQTVSQAIQDLHPQAVIMCGIGFGLRPDKQKLGDIMVAKQIHHYEPQKVDIERGQIPRGDRVTASDRLVDRFRSADIDWHGAPTHFGLVLSGEKLVNDPQFRNWLLHNEPEAIGGEMEGAGLYVAARSEKTDWILVKAICDWADGSKSDNAQPLAARNAAAYVLHTLESGGWEGQIRSASAATSFSSLLDIEYAKQGRLFERLSIHEANLGELLRQKAQFGIRVPLDLVNEIRLQESEIALIKKQLRDVNKAVAEAEEEEISKTNLPRNEGGEKKPVAVLDKFYVNFGDEEYLLDIPYPTLGTESILGRDAQQHTIMFAGGFELQTTYSQNSSGLKMEWYRHGRRVSPILNRESKKLILPLGRHVSVGKLEMIPWNKEEVDNTNESSAKRLDKGGWKLVHPSEVREITTRMETPQGYESYILTTRIAYEGPWEIWTVTSKDDPVRIWFYFDNWSIGPLVDEEHQTLGFSPVGNFGASATT